jgi:transglutaminase-like putative cysteine protease
MGLWSAMVARPPQTPLSSRPSLTLFYLLCGAFLLALVPHAVQFPGWLTATILAGMALRAVIEFYRWPLPSSTFCGILAIILLVLVFIQYNGVSGRDPGTALTAGLLAIKFYELRRPRDVALIIFSCFFVVMSALLYSQVLELFIYCLIMMWVLTALLVRVHAGDQSGDRLLRMLSRSGLVYAQAMPLAVMLFFFFPRYNGTIGLLQDQANIGLTDNVAPGSIARLATNESTAMYVRFPDGNAPGTEAMYWRALVLWNYANGVWTPSAVAGLSKREPELTDTTAPGQIKQEITVKPHNQRWLFALDVPVSKPSNSAANDDWATNLVGDIIQIAGGANKLDHLARYTVISSDLRPEDDLTGVEYTASLDYPKSEKDSIDPKVIEFADDLHNKNPSDQEYYRAVLRYLRHNGFVYTLNPGTLPPGEAWLPRFLFETKSGFCEHFASAFAVLMRLEKIPARVIIGYEGADYNPYDQYYTVTQTRAHAWDEIFLRDKDNPNRGRWMRVDPTAVVGMEGDAAVPNSGGGEDTGAIRRLDRQGGFEEKYLPSWVQHALEEFSLRREVIETTWDGFVLSYDPETQGRLALAMGFGERAGFMLLAVCLAAAGICLFVFSQWLLRKPPVPPVEQFYCAFCRVMARRGIPRAAWEGPVAYTERVAEAFPDEKPAIQRLGSIVARARYGPAPADASVPEQLKSALAIITASQAAASSRRKR